MKTIVKYVYIITSITFLVYLALPLKNMPVPPLDALQSNEQADTEYNLRKAYFTNNDRSEVIDHYRKQYNSGNIFNRYLTFRLNYPPEEAQTIIRDQTRSSYLEEIGQPFRESLFVNGFIPTEQKDAIFIEGSNWLQKLTVRYIPSSGLVRIVMGFILVCFIPVIVMDYKNAVMDLKSVVRIKTKR